MQRPPCASINCCSFSDSSTSGKKNTKTEKMIKRRIFARVLTEGHSADHRHVLGEEDWVSYLNHVHILAAFLEGAVVVLVLLVLLVAEVLITGLLVK